ncbi:hypothetical protein [Inhella inkyongensis]|nr:hypothetical protein [Inhella inkyongensis]
MYRVTIQMPDGSQGEHHGRYLSGVDAALAALALFPQARRVQATWLAGEAL